MSLVNPDEIERYLIAHGRSFLDSLTEKQVVIDAIGTRVDIAQHILDKRLIIFFPSKKAKVHSTSR